MEAAAAENIDPSKLSLKERIKFFASKAAKPAAPQPAKELSPSRLAASATTRSRAALGASALGASAAGAPAQGSLDSVARLGVRLPAVGGCRPLPPPAAAAGGAPAPAAPSPVDAELSEALAAPPLPAAASAAAAPAAQPPQDPARIAFTLPAGSAQAALGIGARLHCGAGGAAVQVGALDPQGAAARAGVQVGDALEAIEGHWPSAAPPGEAGLLALLQGLLASGATPLRFVFRRQQ